MQSNTGHTLSGDELRKLQAVLRKRASNIRKKGKRQGLLRPLSKDDIGARYSTVQFFQTFLPPICKYTVLLLQMLILQASGNKSPCSEVL